MFFSEPVRPLSHLLWSNAPRVQILSGIGQCPYSATSSRGLRRGRLCSDLPHVRSVSPSKFETPHQLHMSGPGSVACGCRGALMSTLVAWYPIDMGMYCRARSPPGLRQPASGRVKTDLFGHIPWRLVRWFIGPSGGVGRRDRRCAPIPSARPIARSPTGPCS